MVTKETDMKKSRLNGAQTIGVPVGACGCGQPAEMCGRHGVTDQTFYRWGAAYSGMGLSDAQKLKALENEGQPLTLQTAP